MNHSEKSRYIDSRRRTTCKIQAAHPIAFARHPQDEALSLFSVLGATTFRIRCLEDFSDEWGRFPGFAFFNCVSVRGIEGCFSQNRKLPQFIPSSEWDARGSGGTLWHKGNLKNKDLALFRNRMEQGETEQWWPETLLHTHLKLVRRAIKSRKIGIIRRMFQVRSQLFDGSCPQSCPQISDDHGSVTDGFSKLDLKPRSWGFFEDRSFQPMSWRKFF